MKSRYKYGLILLILILLIFGIGFLAIKKLRSVNNTESPFEGSNQNFNTKNQINEVVTQNTPSETTKTIQCPDCSGTGNLVCPECNGNGLYYICSACGRKYHTYLNTCPFCGAKNTLVQHICSPTIPCPRCGGSGQIPA
ncbi:MAG: hypothetical protein HVN35_03155 [Methanobacteriaceae archaeon]|nr:hypothetical protein [Methanobacteriaceae archaeon]